MSGAWPRQDSPAGAVARWRGIRAAVSRHRNGKWEPIKESPTRPGGRPQPRLARCDSYLERGLHEGASVRAWLNWNAGRPMISSAELPTRTRLHRELGAER